MDIAPPSELHGAFSAGSRNNYTKFKGAQYDAGGVYPSRSYKARGMGYRRLFSTAPNNRTPLASSLCFAFCTNSRGAEFASTTNIAPSPSRPIIDAPENLSAP